MIFDPHIELQNLESQPEWCGVMDRVKQLNEEKNKLIHRFDKEPKEWIQKAIEKQDEEIKFFENILLFWSRNYRNLENFSKAIDAQIKVSNNGARILSLIEDLKIAYSYDNKMELVLSETFIKLAKSKGLDTDKMNEALNDLRFTVRDYKKHMFKDLNKAVKEVTGE
jgi:hypothetical protein